MESLDLFGDAAPAAIDGLRYQGGFLSAEEEAQLLHGIAQIDLQPAKYKEYTARRKVRSFGGSFDYDNNVLRPAPPLPAMLEPLRARVAQWLGVPDAALVHALLAEYAPGTPLGWHRDVPDFEAIAGVSLGGPAVLRFRPYAEDRRAAKALRLEVAPRSVYAIERAARWDWQHSVLPTQSMRWSITFRTGRAHASAVTAPNGRR